MDDSLDPLLQDLNEKKQSFKRNVVSLATELKDVRSRLALQEMSFAKEFSARREAENKAINMQKEVASLQKKLEEKSLQIQNSSATAQNYLNEIKDLQLWLESTKATADANAQTAKSAQLQCVALLQELDAKNHSFKQQEHRVNKLENQIESLRIALEDKELLQGQLRDDVLRIERAITQALGGNFVCLNKTLISKDDEIMKLKEEIKIISSHLNFKSKNLESQLEKQRRTDYELKQRVSKLELCFQEARVHTRKLHNIGERNEKDLKELKEEIVDLKAAEICKEKEKLYSQSDEPYQQ